MFFGIYLLRCSLVFSSFGAPIEQFRSVFLRPLHAREIESGTVPLGLGRRCGTEAPPGGGGPR